MSLHNSNSTGPQPLQCNNYDNYGIEPDDGVVGLVPYGFNSDSDDSFDLPTKTQNRKKRVQVQKSAWFAAKNKKSRERGKRYYGKQKESDIWNYEKIKEPRAIKQRCKCKSDASTIKCAQINDEERQKIFKQFWQMDWNAKKVYVNTLIQTTAPSRSRNRKVSNESRRSVTLQYHLKVQNKYIRVCRTFFLNTLNVGRRAVLNWLKKPLVSKSNLNESVPKKCSQDRQSLNSFFDSLPSMESHYCRASTNKRYLLPEWRSKKMIYDFYVNDWCKSQKVHPLSISVFYEIFDIKNLSLFSPKKDQCETCSRYSVDNLSYEDYTLHQEKKEEARNEKNQDRNEEANVFTVDLQAVLMAPKSQVSSLYYRTKLQVHNLVFHNLINQKAYCFLWNEAEGGVTAEEFASIWVFFIEEKIIRENDPKKIIFYSDGCNYQNRNCLMSNALLNTAIKHNVTIEQKILETGHTQMEADSVHSTIERAMKNRNIDVPAEYIGICKGARKNPEPYDVTYLDHSFFKTFKNVKFIKNIRPGRGKGDAKVTDIRGIKYTPNGEIYFKLRFPDPWEVLPQRIDGNVVALDWSNFQQLYQERRKITAKKYEDLQYLKTTLPKDHHKFYDDLPHE